VLVLVLAIRNPRLNCGRFDYDHDDGKITTRIFQEFIKLHLPVNVQLAVYYTASFSPPRAWRSKAATRLVNRYRRPLPSTGKNLMSDYENE
jgi:hypothetical protein